MNQNLTRKLVISALIAAVYAALTYALAPISYGLIQFRVSEVMVLLAFFNPTYIGALTLGCLLSNILGGLGILDIIFGTLATFLSVSAISITASKIKDTKKGLIISSIWPVIFNGLIIGGMLSILLEVPMVIAMLQVGIGEFLAVSVVGVPVVLYAQKKYSNKLALR
ncbi:MAG: QueT transporter family protein [Clostridium sp.]